MPIFRHTKPILLAAIVLSLCLCSSGCSRLGSLGWHQKYGIALEADIKSADSIPKLILALDSPNQHVRKLAAQALTDFGPDAAEAISAFIILLDDPMVDCRILAAAGLGAIGPQASAAILPLRDRLTDFNAVVAIYAAGALLSITSGHDQRGTELFDLYLQEPNPVMRRLAVTSLKNAPAPGEKMLATLMAVANKDKNKNVRIVATDVLKSIASAK